MTPILPGSGKAVAASFRDTLTKFVMGLSCTMESDTP